MLLELNRYLDLFGPQDYPLVENASVVLVNLLVKFVLFILNFDTTWPCILISLGAALFKGVRFNEFLNYGFYKVLNLF